ncbi:MAG: DUF4238 domain-containing protein [Burkholderiales bacterium]|nr:DUF4238 domain-containing protein [Burkholderiales bacterium]
MTRPINQHWVPRFYLKHFSTPETKKSKQPQAWVFSKDDGGGDPILTNIRNICAKRYLYSPESEVGLRNWSLESKLQDLEYLLAQIWPAFAEEFIALDAESIRKAVALFVAVLYLRHPSNIEVVTHLHQQLASIFEKAPRGSDGAPLIDAIEIDGKRLPFDSSGWQDYNKSTKADHQKVFVDVVQSEAIVLATILLKKRWSVISSGNPVFVTSDNPVSKQHQSRSAFGFGTEGVVVTFPVSPTRLLVMDDLFEQPAGQYYELSNSGPGPYNLLIWRNGSLMISHRNSDAVMREMIEWADRHQSEHG